MLILIEAHRVHNWVRLLFQLPFYSCDRLHNQKQTLSWERESLFGLPLSQSISKGSQGRLWSKDHGVMLFTSLVLHGLLSLLFDTAQAYLPWGSTTRSVLGSLIPILIGKRQQANFMEEGIFKIKVPSYRWFLLASDWQKTNCWRLFFLPPTYILSPGTIKISQYGENIPITTYLISPCHVIKGYGIFNNSVLALSSRGQPGAMATACITLGIFHDRMGMLCPKRSRKRLVTQDL